MKKSKSRIPRWTVEKIIGDIHKLPVISAKHVQRFNADLYSAAIRYFSTWRTAVEAAGFDYDKVARRRPKGHWNKDMVIREIGQLPRKNSNYVRLEKRNLYSAAIRLFGSWEKAVEAAGFDYEQIRLDWWSKIK